MDFKTNYFKFTHNSIRILNIFTTHMTLTHPYIQHHAMNTTFNAMIKSHAYVTRSMHFVQLICNKYNRFLAIVLLTIITSLSKYSRAPIIRTPIIWIVQLSGSIRCVTMLFFWHFSNFSCKNLSFSADSLKEVEKILLFLLFKNTVFKKIKSLIETF